MAIKKVKLPNNTTQDIHDARVVSDAITYIGDQQGSAIYVDGDRLIDVTTKADKVVNATTGNFAALDAYGNLTDSGHKHSDYQATLVSGTNIKTINNNSLLGSGNITIDSGGAKKLKVVTDLENYTAQLDTSYYYETGSVATFASVLGITTEEVSELFEFKCGLLDFTLIDDIGDSGTSIITPIYNAEDWSEYMGEGQADIRITYSYTPEQNYYGFVPITFGKYVDSYDEWYSICIYDHNFGGEFELKNNLVTSLSQYSDDYHYPSAKCVYDNLATKQAALVSGTNIKTINNQSLLGSGDITVGSGGANMLVLNIDGDDFTPDQYTGDPVHSEQTKQAFCSFLGISSSEVDDLLDGKYDLLEISFTGTEWGGSHCILPLMCAELSDPDWLQTWYGYTTEKGVNASPISFVANGYDNVYEMRLFDNAFRYDFQLTNNLVTSLSSYSTDEEYPSAKCVYDAIQAGGGGGGGTVTSVAMTVPTGLSVSGSPITTNGTLAVSLSSGYEIPQSNSIVHRTGNETISGIKSFSGGSVYLQDAATPDGENLLILGDFAWIDKRGFGTGETAGDFAWIVSDGTSLQSVLNAKQATLVSGTNIKTINSTTLLGSGNISVGTYSKPSGGIPASDLASAVQTSLGKADTALQSYTETDPVFSASAAHGISSTDINNWNAKQKAITVSTSEPTSSQGSNGDIWIVI